MNSKSCCLIFAAGLLTAVVPAYGAPAQDSQSTTPSPYSAQAPMRGEHEAQKMVEAEGTFTENVSSNSAQMGAPCDVKLRHDVTLDNGIKLPKGTILDGKIVQDNTQPGTVHVALRFTGAVLPGKTVPIKATIVRIYSTPTAESYWVGNPKTIPPNWNDGTLAVDQIDALPGIDLHSRIASPNSGVLVSNKKTEVKLGPDYSVALAIGPAENNGMNGMNGMNSGAQNEGSVRNNMRQPANPQR